MLTFERGSVYAAWCPARSTCASVHLLPFESRAQFSPRPDDFGSIATQDC